MSTAVAGCAAFQWLSIGDTILTQAWQGIELAQDADHWPVGIAITCHKCGGNLGHPAFHFEPCFFQRVLQCFGRFEFLIAQFGISPYFIAQFNEHRTV